MRPPVASIPASYPDPVGRGDRALIPQPELADLPAGACPWRQCQEGRTRHDHRACRPLCSQRREGPRTGRWRRAAGRAFFEALHRLQCRAMRQPARTSLCRRRAAASARDVPQAETLIRASGADFRIGGRVRHLAIRPRAASLCRFLCGPTGRWKASRSSLDGDAISRPNRSPTNAAKAMPCLRHHGRRR